VSEYQLSVTVTLSKHTVGNLAETEEPSTGTPLFCFHLVKHANFYLILTDIHYKNKIQSIFPRLRSIK